MRECGVIHFLTIWWLIGAAAVLFRNKMIGDEQPKQYRLMLTILTAPVGLSVNMLVGACCGALRYFAHAKDQYDGDQTKGEE